MPTILIVVTGQISPQAQVAPEVRRLADEYVKLRIQHDPTLALTVGLRFSSEMHFPDRSEAALRSLHQGEDALLRKVQALGDSGSKDPVYSVLREELESRRQLRVCRSELWDLSQTEGWQIALPALAVMQRVTTPEEKKSSHYEPNPDERRVATFWISTDDWADETRGAAEITAVHETIPGHHLQIAIARGLHQSTNLGKIAFNATYNEGWANYAERLARVADVV